MFSKSETDDTRSVNDTSRVVRITIVSDATNWSVNYDRHSTGVIYNYNIFIMQATGLVYVIVLLG